MPILGQEPHGSVASGPAATILYTVPKGMIGRIDKIIFFNPETTLQLASISLVPAGSSILDADSGWLIEGFGIEANDLLGLEGPWRLSPGDFVATKSTNTLTIQLLGDIELR